MFRHLTEATRHGAHRIPKDKLQRDLVNSGNCHRPESCRADPRQARMGILRPKDTRVFHVFRCGPSKNHLQVLDSSDEIAYYLERPAGGALPMYDRAWHYQLYIGNRAFDVGKEPTFVLRRNQSDACIEFLTSEGDIVFILEWAGKGDVGGLTAAPKFHDFYWKGCRYRWSGRQHWTGTDFFCKNTETEEVVAYFRSVMRPQDKEGKLEISLNVTDEELEARLVGTFIAYREWSIRRSMLLFGDPYLNQSVTG